MGYRLILEEAGVLTEEQARRIGVKFIHIKYPEAKLKINRVEFISNIPSYLVEGEIVIPPRSFVSRFVYPPSKYSLKIEIHAEEGRVTRYELH